ncbi:MAG: caspase family protein [Pseudomonadota bacterium]
MTTRKRRARPRHALCYGMMLYLVAFSAIANASNRVALVIGNAAYIDSPLRNPVNDARAMEARLRALGFKVTKLENATRDQMSNAVADFEEQLSSGKTGLFYYAGHGIQVRGQNYLIPVDAVIESEARVRSQAVPLNQVTEAMEYAQSRINFILLDACRNNPFERSMRGGSRGLAAVDAAAGTLISYATAPGSVAADGDGNNGVYTAALLRALDRPGLSAERVFKEVRKEVSKVTRRKQIPWESSSLTGDFYFNTDAPASGTATSAVASAGSTGPARAGISEETAIELMFWETVVDSGNPAMYQEYLEQYPSGRFVRLAKVKLEAASQQPAAAPKGSADRVVKASAATDAVRQLIGRWARAWEDNTTSIDAYGRFYDARFKGRGMDRAAWLADKRRKGQRAQCIRVALGDLDVEVTGDAAVVRFEQRYMSNSYCDIGPKTLLLTRTTAGWRIRSEEQREFKRCDTRC